MGERVDHVWVHKRSAPLPPCELCGQEIESGSEYVARTDELPLAHLRCWFERVETRAAEAERKLAEYKVFFGESGRDELALAASRESEAQLQQAREALERIERRCDHEKGEDHPLYATAIEFISSEARTALETPRGEGE